MSKLASLLAVVVCSLGCSSEAGGPATTADTGAGSEDTGSGPADTGSGPIDTGSAKDTGGGVCTGLSGTYDCTRKRSTTSPGSCAPTYTFAPKIPVKITADSSSASGYKIEVGYTDGDGTVIYVACTNNVAGCTIFATCEPDAGTDQVTLTIDGNNVTGTLTRTNKSPACTVNFDVTGTRK